AAKAASAASSTTASAPAVSQPPARAAASAASASARPYGGSRKAGENGGQRSAGPRLNAARRERRGSPPQAGGPPALAQGGARLGAVVDEQRKIGAARKRLEPERAGAGEEIEHARAAHRIAIGMDEDIEQRLAQPVSGGPDRLRLRRGERAAAQTSADDTHQR